MLQWFTNCFIFTRNWLTPVVQLAQKKLCPKKFLVKTIKSSKWKTEKFSLFNLNREFLSLFLCKVKFNYFQTMKTVLSDRKNCQNQVKNLGNKTEFCAYCTLGWLNFARKSFTLNGRFCAKWFCAKCATGVNNLYFDEVFWNIRMLYFQFPFFKLRHSKIMT